MLILPTFLCENLINMRTYPLGRICRSWKGAMLSFVALCSTSLLYFLRGSSGGKRMLAQTARNYHRFHLELFLEQAQCQHPYWLEVHDILNFQNTDDLFLIASIFSHSPQ